MPGQSTSACINAVPFTKETTRDYPSKNREELFQLWNKILDLLIDYGLLTHVARFTGLRPFNMRKYVMTMIKFWNAAHHVHTNMSSLFAAVSDDRSNRRSFMPNADLSIPPPTSGGMCSVYLWRTLYKNNVPRNTYRLFPSDKKGITLFGIYKYRVHFDNGLVGLLEGIESERRMQLANDLSDEEMHSVVNLK